jgi:hypothetical protein
MAYERVRSGDIPALAFGRRLLLTRATLESMLGALRIHPSEETGDAPL